MLVAEDKARVVKLFKILKRIMRNYGKIISFPKCSDPTKTYSWRYLTRFLEKYDKIELDDSELPGIIDHIIRRAKMNGTLRNGMSVINKVDLLTICEQKLQQDVDKESNSIKKIISSYEFIQNKLLDSDHNKLYDLLVERPGRRAYANITRWMDNGDLSLGFIAVSKTCKRAVSSLEQHELTLYPDVKEFMKIRYSLISNESILRTLRGLLGDDLLEE